MRTLKNLNITKSIESKKLIFEESWFDKFDSFTNYLIFTALIIISVLCFKEINPLSSNDRVGYYIIPIVIAVCLYCFYCKFSEKDLKEISFSIHQQEAMRRITEYGKKNGFKISKRSSDLLFLNEPLSSLSFEEEEKTSIIFFKNQSIFYTVIQNGRRLNTPVLISQHTLKRDLKRILNHAEFDLRPKKSYFDRFFNDSN